MGCKFIKHLLGQHSPVRINAKLGSGAWAWLWKCWRAGNQATLHRNRSHLHTLVAYNRERPHTLTHKLRLTFERSAGCLVLLLTDQNIAMAKPNLKVLGDLGVKFKGLTAGEYRAVASGLSTETILTPVFICPTRKSPTVASSSICCVGKLGKSE